jgi:hypothetical protein
MSCGHSHAPCVCVIGFINTFDSQSYDTNGSHRKHNLPTQQKEKAANVCVCVCTLSSPTPVENLGVLGLQCLSRWRQRVHSHRMEDYCAPIGAKALGK